MAERMGQTHRRGRAALQSRLRYALQGPQLRGAAHDRSRARLLGPAMDDVQAHPADRRCSCAQGGKGYAHRVLVAGWGNESRRQGKRKAPRSTRKTPGRGGTALRPDTDLHGIQRRANRKYAAAGAQAPASTVGSLRARRAVAPGIGSEDRAPGRRPGLLSDVGRQDRAAQAGAVPHARSLLLDSDA